MVRFFGDYELLEEIARGGMGVIYRARQLSLGRVVALKMILAGPFASKQIIQRFRGEVTAAAFLQHPNIVAIHDVGIHDGQHYFTMDYIEGQNLSQLVGNGPLPAAKAARYAKIIAEAIHYAHEQGILHRDLKPSNVLVDASDQPRITDFGLAKRLEGDSSITLTGQMLGSPNFMPPEQASSQRGKVGRPGDVYGLGAILYYLLAGRPPFQAESFESVIHQLLNTEPVSPCLLNSSVPLDLETICLKCLSKEPHKRYATAGELAEELDRFLKDEPIRARPVSRTEKAWRWCRRNPVIASLSTATALLLLAVVIGSPIVAFQFNRERQRAEQSLYDSDMNLAQHAWDDGDLGFTISRLQAHLPRPGERDRRGFEWYYLRKLCQGDPAKTLAGHSQAVIAVAFSPDGKRVATGAVGDPVQVWDCTTGDLVVKLPEPSVVSLAFAPDGRTLGVGGRDHVNVWNLGTRNVVFTQQEALGQFWIAFLPQGTSLLIGKGGTHNFHDGGVTELWNYATREKEYTFPDSGGYIAVSPQGDRLATANWKKTVKIWDVASRTLVNQLECGLVLGMAFSPDGQTLATGNWNLTVSLWDAATARQVGSLTNNQSRVWSLAFSPEGNSLATCADQTVKLWDVATRLQTGQLQGHGGEVMSLAYSPDGQKLATGSRDKTVRVWNVHARQSATTITNVVSEPVFSPDSQFVMAGVGQNRIGAWDVASLQLKSVSDNRSNAATSFPLVRGMTYFSTDFDWTTGTFRKPISAGAPNDNSSAIGLSPDGETLVVGFADGALKFIDAKANALITNIAHAHPDNVFQVAFSPNGKFVASVGRSDRTGNGVEPRIWSMKTHERVATLVGHTEVVLSVAFASDGKTLATCGVDNSIRIWNATTWKEIPPRIVQKQTMLAVVFSPNARTLATVCGDNTLKFWDVATHRELAAFKVDSGLRNLAFSPDGQTLAVWCGDFSLRLWRAPVESPSPN